jgi:hypothetical protein
VHTSSAVSAANSVAKHFCRLSALEAAVEPEMPGGSDIVSGHSALPAPRQCAPERQWVDAVTAYSTEYGGSWSASEVTGPPDIYPQYGDIGGSWTVPASSSSVEWLGTLSFGMSQRSPAKDSAILVACKERESHVYSFTFGLCYPRGLHEAKDCSPARLGSLSLASLCRVALF